MHRDISVICALNEAGNLPGILPLIALDTHGVSLVWGQSTDRTATVARELLLGMRTMQQQGPGTGSAFRTGHSDPTGGIIVMPDADECDGRSRDFEPSTCADSGRDSR